MALLINQILKLGGRRDRLEAKVFGGGNVLQVMCDLTIARESAVFRQVGPMMGSFDAGYGTWYLEDLVGKKKAKEMWMLNPRLSAQEALAIGLINRVAPDGALREETRKMALEVAERGAFALASIKSAFNARAREGAVLVIDTAAASTPRRCDTSDGCTPTCASSCTSGS